MSRQNKHAQQSLLAHRLMVQQARAARRAAKLFTAPGVVRISADHKLWQPGNDGGEYRTLDSIFEE